jgi:hypothetical protein
VNFSDGSDEILGNLKLKFKIIHPYSRWNFRKYLADYFDISVQQMNEIIGLGVNKDSNWLLEAVKKNQEAIRKKFVNLCKKSRCTSKDLSIIQWANNGLTKDIGMPYVVGNYATLNNSIIFNYEALDRNSEYEDKINEYEFPFDVAKKLLETRLDRSRVDTKYSIFNLKNAAVLPGKDPKVYADVLKVQNSFKLDDPKQAQILIHNYQNFKGDLDVYAGRQNPGNEYFKAYYAKAGIVRSLDILSLYTLNNVTMKAFNNYYQQNIDIYPCLKYFEFRVENSEQLTTKICDNANLKIEKYGALTTWIEAVLDPDTVYHKVTYNARNFILNTISMTSIKDWNDFSTNYLKHSFFMKTIRFLFEKFVEWYGCIKEMGGCTRKFLAQKQYISGTITDISQHHEGLKNFPSLSVKSVSLFPENKNLLRNKIPEMYGFLSRNFGYNGNLFTQSIGKTFSNGSTSILNVMSLFLMNIFIKESRNSDLAHKFNIWCGPELLNAY